MWCNEVMVYTRKTTRFLNKKLDFGSLRTAKGAAFDSYDNSHNECLPGTRVDLLDAIEKWATSEDGKCIFWLNGMAGTGKSTISRTIASRLKRQELLGASFFFKKGEEDRGTAKKLFPTLVEQLVVGLPDMVTGVQAAIKNDPNISEKVLREQFEKLFLHPLLETRHDRAKTIQKVIVIDALDECDHEKNIQHLLILLPQVQQLSSVRIRFLLTSRPELPIRLGFSSISTKEHQDMILHEVPEPVIRHDISLYFDNQFARLRQERSLAPDWPGEEATRALVDKAIPLFISAFTLCLFIGDENWVPEKRLRAIIADETTYLSKMDGIYKPVLHQLLTGQEESESQQLVGEFKEIIGVIILLATPLSVNSLSRLLEVSEGDINNRLRRLHSVLNIPDNTEKPVRLFHLSFRDWLVDAKKENSTFWIDEKKFHRTLTRLCLQNMKQNLKKNICNLTSDSTLRSEIDAQSMDYYLPSDLRYSCRYWIHHLAQTKEPAAEESSVFTFLEVHFLHWVEVMSILGLLSEAILMLALLQSVLQASVWNRSYPQNVLISQYNKDPKMSGNLHDMRRFLLRNRRIADVAPLQIYSSSLIFSPELSFVRRTFSKEIPDWIFKPPKTRKTWTAEIQTLEDDSVSVVGVAFSPDNKVLATCSLDCRVRLWDTTTGALQQTLEGQPSPKHAVAFSADGHSIVSGALDRTIDIWDASTGALQYSFCEASGFLELVGTNISPKRHLIASGSVKGEIRLWDVNARVLRQTLSSKGGLQALSLSPDDQLLVLGFCDGTISIWDTSIGVLKDTLKGHASWVRTVSFSPNGRLVASGSCDGIMDLWDPASSNLKRTIDTREYLRPTVGRKDCSIEAVTFSPNSRILASASYDGILRLWDVTTGALLQVLKEHAYPVLAVSFSQNGQLLASGSGDRIVKLWDTSAGSLGGNMQQISPGAAATTTTITQLNAEERKTPTGHSGKILTTKFSPNGQVLASGSSDCMVKLWSVATGALLRTLLGHQDQIGSIVFSPNSQILASGSDDGIVKLWEVTGAFRHTLEGHCHEIITMTFSPDGKMLAARSECGLVKVWDTAGVRKHTLEGDYVAISTMEFSPDGRLLALAPMNGSVNIWDTASGTLVESLTLHRWVTEMKFSLYNACLETDQGSSDIQSQYKNTRPVTALANRKRVSIDGDWVLLDGAKRLWLPSEYRPKSWDSIHCTVALGLASGEVSFMEFCP